jgi:hypothetical protein
MVRHGNRGKRAGKRIVRKSVSICLKLVDGSVCRNSPAESAKMGLYYVIDWTDDVNSGAESAVRVVAVLARQIRLRSPASLPAPNWMIRTYWLSIVMLWRSCKMIAPPMTVGRSPKWVSMERQRRVNDFGLIFWAINGLHCHINQKKSNWPAFDVKRRATCSLPYARNHPQRSITNFWSCILDNQKAVRQH